MGAAGAVYMDAPPDPDTVKKSSKKVQANSLLQAMSSFVLVLRLSCLLFIWLRYLTLFFLRYGNQVGFALREEEEKQAPQKKEEPEITSTTRVDFIEETDFGRIILATSKN